MKFNLVIFPDKTRNLIHLKFNEIFPRTWIQYCLLILFLYQISSRKDSNEIIMVYFLNFPSVFSYFSKNGSNDFCMSNLIRLKLLSYCQLSKQFVIINIKKNLMSFGWGYDTLSTRWLGKNYLKINFNIFKINYLIQR